MNVAILKTEYMYIIFTIKEIAILIEMYVYVMLHNCFW